MVYLSMLNADNINGHTDMKYIVIVHIYDISFIICHIITHWNLKFYQFLTKD